MSYCPKCGTKVSEEMSFCPKCGAALKVEAAPPAPYRAEKHEKREKEEKEKREKTEKHEKQEYTFISWLIGGLVMMFLGLMFYLALIGSLNLAAAGAFMVVTIGIIIIIGAAYAAMMAARRHPAT